MNLFFEYLSTKTVNFLDLKYIAQNTKRGASIFLVLTEAIIDFGGLQLCGTDRASQKPADQARAGNRRRQIGGRMRRMLLFYNLVPKLLEVV